MWIDSVGTKRASSELQVQEQVMRTIQQMDLTVLNTDLLVALVRQIATTGSNAGVHGASAVLVFLPGLAEITAAVRALQADPLIGSTQFAVYPLHSTLSTEAQRAIFQSATHTSHTFTRALHTLSLFPLSLLLSDCSTIRPSPNALSSGYACGCCVRCAGCRVRA